MGTANSKKKRPKRKSHRLYDEMESKENRPPSRSTSYTASLNPNRLSADFDFNVDENKRTIYLSRDSLLSSQSRNSSLCDSQMSTTTGEPIRRSLTSIDTNLSNGLSYHGNNSRDLKVDNHPVLTKLQNEQNARVESFENRLNKIRTNAIQAAERRKFAYLFKAKDRPSDRNKYDCRELMTQYKTAHNGFRTSVEEDDKGEIIPVHVIKGDKSSDANYKKDPSPPRIFDSINPFNDVRIFLMLPFLLPFFIIICLLRGLSLVSVSNGPRTSSFKVKKVNK